MLFPVVLIAHWLNDFVGQGYLFPSLEIGKNKSQSWSILSLHILLYSGGMWLMLMPFLGVYAFFYAALNGMAHFVIDAGTSRASHDAYFMGNLRLFWTIIGLDQLLHVGLLWWLMPR